MAIQELAENDFDLGEEFVSLPAIEVARRLLLRNAYSVLFDHDHYVVTGDGDIGKLAGCYSADELVELATRTRSATITPRR